MFPSGILHGVYSEISPGISSLITPVIVQEFLSFFFGFSDFSQDFFLDSSVCCLRVSFKVSPAIASVIPPGYFQEFTLFFLEFRREFLPRYFH